MERWTDPETLKTVPHLEQEAVCDAVVEALGKGPEEGLDAAQIAYAASRDLHLVSYALLDLQELGYVELAYSRYDDANYGAYRLADNR